MTTQTTALTAAAARTGKAPATRQEQGLKALLANYTPAIKAALPAVMTPERFIRIAQSALSSSPALQQATPTSFFGALMTAAQLGLEPNTPLGQAYLIPFRNHCVMEAQFQLGYKGLIALAYRSGQVTSIQSEVVCEGDDFEYEMGLDPKLKHRPAMSGRGAPTHYYAVWKTKDGAVGFAVMGVEDIKAHAKKFSKSVAGGRPSPWDTNFDEMAKKTVLKKALKYAPLASDFVRGLASDNSIRDYTRGVDALDTASKTDENGEVIDIPVESETTREADQEAGAE
jgi:recombination protein RecT